MNTMTHDPYTPSEGMLAFLRQNPLCGAGMSFDQIRLADENGLARHHAGNMYVLQGEITEGTSVPQVIVKMHDSWGGDYSAIVHNYDPDYDGSNGPDGDPKEHVASYDDPRVAAEAFFALLMIEKETD